VKVGVGVIIVEPSITNVRNVVLLLVKEWVVVVKIIKGNKLFEKPFFDMVK